MTEKRHDRKNIYFWIVTKKKGNIDGHISFDKYVYITSKEKKPFFLRNGGKREIKEKKLTELFPFINLHI